MGIFRKQPRTDLPLLARVQVLPERCGGLTLVGYVGDDAYVNGEGWVHLYPSTYYCPGAQPAWFRRRDVVPVDVSEGLAA